MTIDPRTIAAEIMTDFARDVGKLDIAAYIGQKYDGPDATSANIDAVAELIAKTGIDLIWPDGTQNTELDAARVDIDRLTAERDAQALAAEQNRSELDMVRTLDRQEIARLNGELEKVRAIYQDALWTASQHADTAKVLRAELADVRNQAHRDEQEHQQVLRDNAALANERDALKRQMREISLLKCWTNEDGKRFIFVTDIQTALRLPTDAEAVAP